MYVDLDVDVVVVCGCYVAIGEGVDEVVVLFGVVVACRRHRGDGAVVGE